MLGVGQGGDFFHGHWFGYFSCVCYSLLNLYEEKKQNFHKTRGIGIYFKVKGRGAEK